jgi:divinyl protochlorophyllide a 8-vinyl-reductase
MSEERQLYNSVAPLRNVAALVALVDRVQNRAHGLPGMACFYGPSGFGKSTSAVYAENKFRAYQVQVKSAWTAKKFCDAVLSDAQIAAVPTGDHMISEIAALRVHRWLALREPVACFAIAEEAAQRTADYIIANRIPAPAVWLLQRLPARLSAPLLMQAIRRHAWTFVGAGKFIPHGAWAFTIDRSGADDPLMPPDSLFHWYAAVFERLYQRLVAPQSRCRLDVPVCVTDGGHRYTITHGSDQAA